MAPKPKVSVEDLKSSRESTVTDFNASFEEIQELLLKDNPDSDDYILVCVTVELLQEQNDKIADLQEQIEELTTPEELSNERTLARKTRIDIRCKLLKAKKFLDSQAKSEKEADKTKYTEVKDKKSAQLPKLKLPTFDGIFTQWTPFWDTIKADVINTNYEDISKFNYIKGQLTGAALESVTGIQASADNLSILIQTLEERFGQPRKILRAHVCDLIDLTPPEYDFTSLNQFYNQVQGNLRSLENLGIEIRDKNGSTWVVPILERKLPSEIREKMGTCGQLEFFDLDKFLGALVQQLDNIAESEHDGSLIKNVPTATALHGAAQRYNDSGRRRSQFQARSVKCAFCDRNHQAKACKLSPEERYNAARERKLCFGCLRNTHTIVDCRDKSGYCKCSNWPAHNGALHKWCTSNRGSNGHPNAHGRAA